MSQPFQTDIQRLLHIIIRSVYSNKDVFLRELISNSSDAIDKYRILNIGNQEEYFIKINTQNNELHIIDNGIGMDKDDLNNNLSTIAHSGTHDFVEKFKDQQDVSDLIGQFGIGFYSSFLVSSSVEIITKKYDCDKTYKWISDGEATYTIEETEDRLENSDHGTHIKLIIKDENYLLENTLKKIIQQYSQFISYPIMLWVEKEKDEEYIDDETTEENTDETEYTEEEVKVEEEEVKTEEKKVETKKRKVKYNEWEQINGTVPLWYKEPTENTKEDYIKLYQTLTNMPNSKPLYWRHFKAEGTQEFRGIFYVSDRFNNMRLMNNETKNDIKLYVKRVLIMDNCSNEFVPEWMSFVTGVIDSNDLPLNISREMLQTNEYVKGIKKYVKKQVVKMLSEFFKDDRENYTVFYSDNQKHLKWGISDGEYSLGEFLLWNNSKDEKLICFDDYIENHMKEGQKEIFYMTADSIEDIKKSIFMETFFEKDICVLYMTESIDEFMIQRLPKYKEYSLVNITKEFQSELFKQDDDDQEKEKTNDEKEETLLTFIKEYLKEQIKDVKKSFRLKDSPACLTAEKFGWSGHMEKIMKSQPLQDKAINYMTTLPKNLEINMEHPYISTLNELYTNDKEDPKLKEKIDILYQLSVLQSGFNIKDSNEFCKKIYSILV